MSFSAAICFIPLRPFRSLEAGIYKLLKGQREVVTTRQIDAVAARQKYCIKSLLYYQKDTLLGTLKDQLSLFRDRIRHVSYVTRPHMKVSFALRPATLRKLYHLS